MNYMITYSSKKFDPLQMSAEHVCLEDIAHALSLLCRGGGHLKHFYSVAQHCVNCAKEAEARGWSKDLVLLCLLHDASEAYISDIIRPVKVNLSNYMEIENKIMDMIVEKYGLTDLYQQEMAKWKQIDDEILEHELKFLTQGEMHRNPAELAAIPDFSERGFREVESEFLRMAERLVGGVG